MLEDFQRVFEKPEQPLGLRRVSSRFDARLNSSALFGHDLPSANDMPPSKLAHIVHVLFP
jgi:hypothetical protein